jgi:hypothetical protein
VCVCVCVCLYSVCVHTIHKHTHTHTHRQGAWAVRSQAATNHTGEPSQTPVYIGEHVRTESKVVEVEEEAWQGVKVGADVYGYVFYNTVGSFRGG